MEPLPARPPILTGLTDADEKHRLVIRRGHDFCFWDIQTLNRRVLNGKLWPEAEAGGVSAKVSKSANSEVGGPMLGLGFFHARVCGLDVVFPKIVHEMGVRAQYQARLHNI